MPFPLLLAIAQQAASALPDHRYAYTIQPVSRVQSLEWRCRQDAQDSLIRVRVDDAGAGKIRNSVFKITLLSSNVAGAPLSQETRGKLTQAFGQLQQLHQLNAMCRVSTPSLEIKGSSHDGIKHNLKSFTVDLK